MGYLDEFGFLFLAGRIKEQINRGGEKISPLEIDGILLQHPAVSEAISFGVPHPLYGQEVEAAVVLKSGASATESELQAFVQNQLADFKVPKTIYITQALPKTATGKIQRRVVADTFVSSRPKL